MQKLYCCKKIDTNLYGIKYFPRSSSITENINLTNYKVNDYEFLINKKISTSPDGSIILNIIELSDGAKSNIYDNDYFRIDYKWE